MKRNDQQQKLFNTNVYHTVKLDINKDLRGKPLFDNFCLINMHTIGGEYRCLPMGLLEKL
jgi:hypothetical protein